ncbi:MAG TPA: hypothetical protein VKJ00_09490, partial [Thermoanaerobaculia bacterium]|nr:hypothetical protein [Thermoanaerobaculia bacterium]
TMPSWQPATPQLMAKPKSGAAGVTVRVSGSGFALGEKVNLTFVDADGVPSSLGSATVGGSGTFIKKVTIPATAPAGKSQIQAKESPLGRKSTAKFTVV